MKRLSLLAVLVLLGCGGNSTDPRGHWGDRITGVGLKDWTQEYFADSDGHLVGWVSQDGTISVKAYCDDDRVESLGDFIASYESREDAQLAVEHSCSLRLNRDQ